jgi:two-component system response regulator GlrR
VSLPPSPTQNAGQEPERRTAPVTRSGLVRLDKDTGTLRSRRCYVAVMSGPDMGKEVDVEGTLFIGSSPESGLCLNDPTVSRYHLEVRVRGDGVRVRDVNSTNGTFMAGTRIETVVVEKEATLKVGSSVLKIAIEEQDLGKPETHRTRFGPAVGESPGMRALFGLLARISDKELSVMLLGETGTGKEVISRGIHEESHRRGGPFVVVDCGSIAPELIESELFGHVKGAFTGAIADRKGAFLEADGGTVFLDEIGELPLALQPKLLRVLEARTVKRLGEDKHRRVDVRVVSATHRDLEREVEAGRFRRDLFFRLAVVVATVPPLRERLEDLPLLAKHFMQQMGRGDFEMPLLLLQKLRTHPWPGNVRELRNVVQRALAGVEFEEGMLSPSGSMPALSANALAAAKPLSSNAPRPETLRTLSYSEAKDQIVEAFTRDYLVALLEQFRGNLSAVARTAGLNRNYVRRLVTKYNLRSAE